MNECTRIEELVGGWEEGRALLEADLELIKRHCEDCASCAGRLGVLLPLIARDVLGSPIGAAENPSPGFVDAVMEKAKSRRPARPRFRAAQALAVAAGLLACIAAGLFALRAAAGPPANEVVVRFELVAPGAKSVALAGSFTDWKTSQMRMRDTNGDGVWEISVTLKKDEVYTYNFLIDGKRWVEDPGAETQVDDGFGGKSSVLVL
jgi:hypothetical protein